MDVKHLKIRVGHGKCLNGLATVGPVTKPASMVIVKGRPTAGGEFVDWLDFISGKILI